MKHKKYGVFTIIAEFDKTIKGGQYVYHGSLAKEMPHAECTTFEQAVDVITLIDMNSQ